MKSLDELATNIFLVSNIVAQVSNQVILVSTQLTNSDGSLVLISNRLTQVSNQISQVSNLVAQATNRLNQISNQVFQVSNQLASVDKALERAEPRYPIFIYQTNLTLPGSYYLVTNLFSGTNVNDAITIRTNISNITVDLNGFSIINTNPPSGASPVGVRISEATNIVVRNGQFIGMDRGVRAEGLFYGIVVENVHVHHVKRAGIEADGIAGDGVQTITIRNCVVEDVDGTGEGASVSCDGIVVLNCTGVVDNCVIRHIVAVGTGSSSCINAFSPTNSFINNNYLSQADVGLKMSGGGTRVYYRNNLTSSCGTAFSGSGGVDRGGNF
jgi:hypothetical protein